MKHRGIFIGGALLGVALCALLAGCGASHPEGGGFRVSAADGEAVPYSGASVKLTRGGEYALSGTFAGQVTVDAPKHEAVTLRLNGAAIENPDGPALYVLSAKAVNLILTEGTESALSDGPSYTPDAEGADAALYSKANLEISGGGGLTVKGNLRHGIVSKDNLTIAGGRVTVAAVSDGLRGKDGVSVRGGQIAVTAGGDGVYANNKKDAGRGQIALSGGELDIRAQGHGLRSAGNLAVTGGALTIDSGKDALNAGGDITISGGEMALTAADDGAHADGSLTVTAGSIRVLGSYEGLEGERVTIGGGQIEIKSANDGINASSASDSEGACAIAITGGVVIVDASGDGIDSNGTLSFEGGEVYISGPDDGANGALDADGAMRVSGGTLLALGSAKRAMKPDGAGQAVAMVTVEEVGGGLPVTVRDGNGQTLMRFTPAKAWRSAVFSAPGMTEGETFYLYAGERQIAAAKTAGR